MLQPTSWKDAWRYPVTVPMAASAAAVTTYWWSGREINGFFMAVAGVAVGEVGALHHQDVGDAFDLKRI